MESRPVAEETIEIFARSIYREASKYGFNRLHLVSLINILMDLCISEPESPDAPVLTIEVPFNITNAAGFPLRSDRITIDRFEYERDLKQLEQWVSDEYGRHFLLSSATAQPIDVKSLARSLTNHIGIIKFHGGGAIGAVAFLDHNVHQKRAELRKLIGDPTFRGQGLAEEATRLWIAYGFGALKIEKIYVSTLQTHLNNIKLNEEIGFKIEGLLRNEVLVNGVRHDVLRMGICNDGTNTGALDSHRQS